MWGPDMRGYKEYFVTRFQTYFHQVPAVQAQDGASVRFQIAYCTESGVQTRYGVKIWHCDDVMNFSGFVVFFVDEADFDGEYKSHLSAAGRRQLGVDTSPEV